MFLKPDVLQGMMGSLGFDLRAFAPELIASGVIILLLVLRMFRFSEYIHLGWVAFLGVLAAFVVSWGQWTGSYGILTPADYFDATRSRDMFSGLLVFDNFTVFVRLFLYGFTLLLVWLSMLTGIPDYDDAADFYTLVLGSVIGMAMMASANHLLMVFIAVEMASLPSYALAGFLKGRRQSSEASLKYVVYGGGAAGIMLYGISLIAGKFGTGYLPDITTAVMTTVDFAPPANAGFDPLLVLGCLFILIGIFFKLASVPFHFWCPDVFEGAAAEVAAFLSVASKGAALALLGRFAFTISGIAGPSIPDFGPWLRTAIYLVPGLAIAATLTSTLGNLAAFPQTNLKRLLAYSTIAHAGYMMLGMATLTKQGAAAVLFYLVAYLFMNMGAFAVVAFMRNLTGSEDISAYRGLITRAPFLTIVLAIFLLSLLGIPPLAGFAAKFQIFMAVYDAGAMYLRGPNPWLGYILIAALVAAGINTVISAVYYVRVLKVMIIERSANEMEGLEPERLQVPEGLSFYAFVLSIFIFVLGIFWNRLAVASDKGVTSFQNTPTWSRTASN